MESGLTFRVGKKIQKIEDLVIGSYYKFYEEIYLYCGHSEPFANAYAFVLPIGTLYMNRAQVVEVIEKEGMRIAKICKGV